MFIGTREECELLQAAMNKSLGLPKRDGVHVGGGTHVDIPDEYSPGAPGWTENYTAINDDETRGSALDLGPFEKVEDFTATKFDPNEWADLRALQAKIEKDEPLPEDWKPKVEEAPKEEPPKEEPPVVILDALPPK